MLRTFAFTAAMIGTQTFAQGRCGPQDDVIAHLNNQWGETVQVMGRADNGHIMMIFANEDTGTWTALMQDPASDMICVAASGKEYAAIYSEPAPNGDPT